MLEIRNLHASVDGRELLRGLDLSVRPGEVHAIVGPGGSGKSTLAQVLAGRARYEVTAGEVRLLGHTLSGLAPEERAALGVFVAFEAPVALPGLDRLALLRAAVNARRRLHGERALDELALLGLARRKLAGLELDPGWVQRSSDEGASGDGERMREALLQLAVLEPRMAILDGTDGGLDGEALESLARGVNALRAPERSMLILTRRPDLLERVVPDRVHVLVNGRFVHSGGPELARGLAWTDDGAGAWDGWTAEAAREVHAS